MVGGDGGEIALVAEQRTGGESRRWASGPSLSGGRGGDGAVAVQRGRGLSCTPSRFSRTELHRLVAGLGCACDGLAAAAAVRAYAEEIRSAASGFRRRHRVGHDESSRSASSSASSSVLTPRPAEPTNSAPLEPANWAGR